MAEPLDIASVPHPRIGYTGNLKTQLDWQLLHSLALRHRDWSFVFVGPRILTQETRSTMDAMSRLSNVYMLGAKTVRDLSAYPQHFDVCVMPYVNNGYTQNIYPLKLHEYLASGRPVVGSPIRSLRDFGKIIALATTVDEWTAALASALTPPVTSCEAATVRQRVARQHDWNELTYRIARTICERLGPEFTSRMTQMSIGTPNFP